MSEIKDNETFVKWHDAVYPEKAVSMYSLLDLHKAFTEGLNIRKDTNNINLILIKTRIFDILQTLSVMATQDRTDERDTKEGDFEYAYDWFCDESRYVKDQLDRLQADIERVIYDR